MRLLRALVLALLAVVLLVVLAAAAGWWWAGTEGSARWALAQAARRVPLQADGVTGSLRHGVHATRLAWRQDGLSVEAREFKLAWQPLALLQREVRLDRLHAGSVVVQDQRPSTGERPKPPERLVLPMRVAAPDIVVGRFEWRGATPIELRELAAGYRYDGSAHELKLRNLLFADGHYRGELRLGDRPPFDTRASVAGRIVAPVPGAPTPLAVVFGADAAGTLAALDVKARVQPEAGSAADATRAQLTARVRPFEVQPVERAEADLQAFDARAIWPRAPTTSLSGRVSVAPRGTQTWGIAADLRNALPGPWDRQRVPADSVRLQGEWRLPALVLVRELEARVGGGRVQARGEWEGEDAWRVDGTLAGVDPSAVHSAMAPLPLGGRIALRAQGRAYLFDADVAAAGPARAAPPGSELAAAVGALSLRSLQAKGRWAGEALSLSTLVVNTDDAKLDAAVDYRRAAKSGRGRAQLDAPGLQVRAVGSLAQRNGGGNVKVTVDDLVRARQWLAKLPAVPAAVRELTLAGRADLQAAWQGGWEDPTVQGTLNVPQLTDAAAAGWSVRDATVRVDGRLADARVDLRGQAQLGGRQLRLEGSGRGGRRPDGSWQGQVASLQAALRDPALHAGPWQLQLRRPLAVTWQAGRLEAGASEANLVAPVANAAPALLAWEPVRWDRGELRTQGRLAGLPLAWVELAGGPQLAGSALGGDLVFDARWDVVLAETLRAQLVLERRSGDVSLLAETTEGTAARVQAGVRAARLQVDAQGDAVTAELLWDSERAGNAQARLASRLSREGGGWSWPEGAPLTGQVRAQLPRLGVWSLLAPPGWRLRGSVVADVQVAGTRAEPDLRGTLNADDLALRSVVDGVALQDGRLRARLDGRRVLVDEFLLRGAGLAGGTVSGSGEGAWTRAGVQARLATRIDRLRASIRADRELTLSGRLDARMDPAGPELRGDLRVDRARITLPDEAAPQLGDDVVVRNLPPGTALGGKARARDDVRGNGRTPLRIAVNLDFGDDFRVSGRGIQTRLAGTLAIGGESIADPRMTGVIRTAGGEYRAYGQRLDIERGVLRFTGPPDNPALDILAIRPRLTQRVGVQVTGTAQAPFVRLYAEPDLSEAEKLSWLVLGRPAAAGGAETALLQSAALALLQRRAGGGGSGKGPAELLGLDELGFRREGAEGPAVTLGKRLGRNLYASYERSLSGALGTLYVFYDIAQRVTIRAQAGERAAVDLIFTFSYD